MKRHTLLALSLACAAPMVAQAPRAQPVDSATNALLERADRGRILGDPNARVWLVEISDFQCPFCKMWHDSTFAKIHSEFIATGLVRMAYVNYPVDGHQHAVLAAEAAMCASVQDKFWPLHDRLFKTQKRWAAMKDSARVAVLFDSLAVAGGVNVPQWRSCVSSRALRRLIEADRYRSTRSGVKGTPYFLIGEEAINGAAPYDVFERAILRAAAKSVQRKP